MTNREIRSWYLREVAKIAALDQERRELDYPLEMRARLAWQQRHDLRLRAREMMESVAEAALLRDRDLSRYGSPDGPTFELLVERALAQGFDHQGAYNAILSSSLSTDENVNKLFGL